ncbi:hypothetical protein GYH30_057133 [Glycine max]|nr:hypothetical protein GYH30_057133 [Glycine max]
MNTKLYLEALEIEEGSPRNQGSETLSSRANTYDSKIKNVPKLTRRKSTRIKEDLIPSLNSLVLHASLDTEFGYFKSSWKNFTLVEIQAATDDFSHGGYAEVYMGKLEDGNFVSIKRLTRGCREEMIADFLSELGIIVHVDHPNIARLIGYGVEGEMFLVLHLSPHGPREKLNWSIRYKIAMGIAKGLHYICMRGVKEGSFTKT